MEIKSKYGGVIFKDDGETVKATVEAAAREGVSLNSADLKDADLSGADLRRAALRWGSLEGADLRDAVLKDADLGGTKSYARRPAGCRSFESRSVVRPPVPG